MSRAKLLSILVAVLALPAVAQAADSQPGQAAPPTDYTSVQGLSQPTYTEIRRDVVRLPSWDGTELYLEVVRPDADGPFPVILEASPYHGTLADRDGTRILPDPKSRNKPIGLTGWFAPRGYAVVYMDLRGTGRSRGCLDHLGPNDAKDLKHAVEWSASQGWSNGKVGMTGHSYVGSTPMVAAAQRPNGLATIVPSAGLASMYDHQFQAGVPYFLQWAGPQWSYELLALDRKLPPDAGPEPVGGGNTGDDTDADGFPNNPEDTGCGVPNSALVSGEDQLSGRYASWHAARDSSAGATDAPIPAFVVHGVNDNAARIPAMQWFTDRGGRKGDKLWLGQWDHGSGCCPNRRKMQWPYALLAWFDKQLKGADVDTGPALEAFLSDSTFEQARAGARSEIYTAKKWPPRVRMTRFSPDASGAMTTTAPPDGSVSFAGDARSYTVTNGTGGAVFSTAPLERDLVLVGVPKLRLSTSVTAPRLHLIGTLYDERPEDGNRRRITQCTINPELRDGIDKVTPVVPATRYDLAPPCMAMAQHVRAGHKLVLRVTTADPDKAPLFANDPKVTVFTGASGTAIDVPAVPGGSLFLHPDDLPLDQG